MLGEYTPETAASLLAGILIGGDIRDAVRAFQSRCHTEHVTARNLAIQGLSRIIPGIRARTRCQLSR